MSAAFCSQCGNQVSEHQRFCPSCGSPIESNGNSVVAISASGAMFGNNDRMDVRNKELRTMDDLIKFFSVKQSLYDEYDRVSDIIYRLSCGTSKSGMIWGIIVMAAGLLVMCIGVSSVNSNSYYDSGDLATFVIFSLLIMAGGGGLMGIFFGLKSKRRNQLVEYTNKYYELSDELYQYYCGYNNCPIGPEYTNPTNLMVVQRTIISGRADTIKEALNLLIEDAHREKMENLASKTAQYAQQAAVYAQQTAANSQKIRRNTAVSAVFTVANYFK